MTESSLGAALRSFEATEANLEKLEKLWAEIHRSIPSGISFGSNAAYEDRCRSFALVLEALPKIDGWKPETLPLDLDDIAQSRFDAAELGEPSAHVAVERSFEAPGEEIREYRFRFNQKRREIIRDELVRLIDANDSEIREIQGQVKNMESNELVKGPSWDSLRSNVDQIDALLGSSVQRPSRWQDLRRHLHFGMVGDFLDVEKNDWPTVKEGLREGLYGAHEPLPVDVGDFAELVAARPRGAVTTKLRWANLSAEEFERLIFALISNEPGYENPEWLMHTNAPDRGRDLSVTRITEDRLSGTKRARVVIQCRHRQSSVSISDVATLKEQMKTWADPRVDTLVVATSGRFTTDAVDLIERQNNSGDALKIDMWPDSHLERLLAARPALIAEFQLR